MLLSLVVYILCLAALVSRLLSRFDVHIPTTSNPYIRSGSALLLPIGSAIADVMEAQTTRLIEWMCRIGVLQHNVKSVLQPESDRRGECGKGGKGGGGRR